jgi:hypothetical protein
LIVIGIVVSFTVTRRSRLGPEVLLRVARTTLPPPAVTTFARVDFAGVQRRDASDARVIDIPR